MIQSIRNFTNSVYHSSAAAIQFAKKHPIGTALLMISISGAALALAYHSNAKPDPEALDSETIIRTETIIGDEQGPENTCLLTPLYIGCTKKIIRNSKEVWEAAFKVGNNNPGTSLYSLKIPDLYPPLRTSLGQRNNEILNCFDLEKYYNYPMPYEKA